MKIIYVSTIFLSSFLLFLVQPMIAKMILPWFGGTSTVWITCVLFFQLDLLAGYFYAHRVSSTLSPARQSLVHGLVLASSLVFLPVVPSSSWKLSGLINPSLNIAGLLVSTVGLPYLLLSTTSPLLQSWYARHYSTAFPYRLFALSNLASLLGLLSYPFLIEPRMTLHHQSLMWSVGFALFVVLFSSICYARFTTRDRTSDPSPSQPPQPLDDRTDTSPGTRETLLWLLLSACSSILLLSTTDHLLQNIAAIPLLWIVPLSLYLLSFILCFDRDGWYAPRLFYWLVFAALIGMSYGLGKWGVGNDIGKVICAYCAGLFVCCMFCHGELARRKPAARHLTLFYLVISIGGALGSIFVVLIAPHLFSFYFELPVGLVLCAVLLLVAHYRAWWVTDFAGGALIVRLLIVAYAYVHFYVGADDIRVAVRNFYGHQRVVEVDTGSDDEYRTLIHGTITHGIQFRSREKRRLPTAYYGPASGIGLAIQSLPELPRRIGVLGLGAGTMASYARAGDAFTYYEINPQVEELARSQFSFISDCRGSVEIELGDGRLSLEQGPQRQFDLLAIDVFSGDSIPVHLLTIQALELYFSQLKPDGILAFNVSNLYLDIPQVLDRAATELGKHAVVIVGEEDDAGQIYQSEWVLMANRPETLDTPALGKAGKRIVSRPDLRTWTDDYSNLLAIFH